ncbi:MAG: hypothetical protein HY738_04420 [Bacteroidia bacterium]|nr:hypothetical protein [Bacteroidia bacterium]
MFYHKIDFRNSRNYNVCKSLKGDVLVYIIFIDTKTTSPWTDFDIKSTMDSVNIAAKWLEEQAMKNNINLKLSTDYYIGQNFLTIIKDLPEGTVRKSLTTPNLATGIENINKWADFIAKKAGATFDIVEKEGIPEVKNPKNKERFIAYLRDQHKLESVGLLFLVNNYYRDDISVAVNTMNSDDANAIQKERQKH